MPHELFQITEIKAAKVVELSLPESLDSGEFDRLNTALLEELALEPDGRWILDWSRLSYMGSSALGLMVNIRQRVKQAGGVLILCGMSPRLLQIFQTCCMERLFTIKPARADALRAVERR
jgi:anti-anti-sigma factor